MKVLSKRCNECLFSGAKIVGDRRKQQLLADIRREQGYFICHKATIKGSGAVCRGFYDERGQEAQLIRIAQRLNVVLFVDEASLGEKGDA